MTAIILASASPIRKKILEAAGVDVEVVPARVDEQSVRESLLAQGAQPRAVADALAELKAIRVSASHPGALVLGCDQVLVFEGELIGKSENVAQARSLLARLRGKTHELVTAVVLAKDGAPIWRHVDHATLAMRDFGDAFLDDYLAEEGDEILGSVGCYFYEGRGAQLFSNVMGDYFSILGLPLLPVLAALRDQRALTP